MNIEFNGWVIEVMEDAPAYVYVARVGKPGAVHVKAEAEGFVADIWPESYEAVEASATALYTDLDDMADEDNESMVPLVAGSEP